MEAGERPPCGRGLHASGRGGTDEVSRARAEGAGTRRGSLWLLYAARAAPVRAPGRRRGGARPIEALDRRFPRDCPVVPLRLCCNPEAKSRVRAAGCRGSQVCGGCLVSLDGERRCLRNRGAVREPRATGRQGRGRQ